MKKNHKVTIAVIALIIICVAIAVKKSKPAETVPEKATPAPGQRALQSGAFNPLTPFDSSSVAGDLVLEGQVLDESGAGVGEASVRLSEGGATQVTEADGSFVFPELVEGSYSLSATSGVMSGQTQNHRLDENSDPVVIRMIAGAALDVLVVTGDAEKVAGAQVSTSLGQSGVTGKDGTVRLLGVRGSFEISASAEDFAVTSVMANLAPGEKSLQVTLSLISGSPANGRVLSEDGKPIAEARVVPSSPGNIAQNYGADSAITDSEGRFSFPTVPRGEFQFTALHPEFAPATSRAIVFDGTTAQNDITIKMPTGASVAGFVLNSDGEPVKGAAVRLATEGDAEGIGRMRTTESGADGSFTLAGLLREPSVILASADEGTSPKVTLDLLAKKSLQNIELSLKAAATISGNVVDESGEPLAEIGVSSWPVLQGTVTQSRAFLAGEYTAVTDGAGGFAFNVDPDGEYWVQAQTKAQGTIPRELALPNGKPILLVVPSPGRIVGQVELASGGVPSLIAVEIGAPPATPFSSNRFVINDVSPGTYDLRIRGPEFQERIVQGIEVRPGQDSNTGTIIVTKGRSISGVVTRGTGTPVPQATVVLGRAIIGDGTSLLAASADPAMTEQLHWRVTETDSRGSYSFSNVEDEDLVLAADHAEFGRSQTLPVPQGTSSEIFKLSLVEAASISGMVAGTRSGANYRVTAVASEKQQSNRAVAADGSFRFEGLSPGSYTVSVWQGTPPLVNVHSVRVSVAAGAPTQVELSAMPPGSSALAVSTISADGRGVPTDVFWFSNAVTAMNPSDVIRALHEGTGYKSQRRADEGIVTLDNIQTDRGTVCGIALETGATACLPLTGAVQSEITIQLPSSP